MTRTSQGGGKFKTLVSTDCNLKESYVEPKNPPSNATLMNNRLRAKKKLNIENPVIHREKVLD